MTPGDILRDSADRPMEVIQIIATVALLKRLDRRPREHRTVTRPLTEVATYSLWEGPLP